MRDKSNPLLEFEFNVLDQLVPNFGRVGWDDWVSDNVVLIKVEAFFCDLHFVAVGSEFIWSEPRDVEGSV